MNSIIWLQDPSIHDSRVTSKNFSVSISGHIESLSYRSKRSVTQGQSIDNLKNPDKGTGMGLLFSPQLEFISA